MARYNELLVGRINRFAQKVFSLKGPASVVSVDDAIHLQIPMFHGRENRYLESWNSFGFGTNAGASAGNVAALQLRNPASSNVIAVIEKLSVASVVAQQFNFYNGAISTDLAGGVLPISGSRLDPRGNPQPSLVMSSVVASSITALTNTFGQILVGANGTGDFIITDIQEIPLLPGDAVRVASTTVNTFVIFNWQWRERHIEESERT